MVSFSKVIGVAGFLYILMGGYVVYAVETGAVLDNGTLSAIAGALIIAVGCLIIGQSKEA
jgi:hypothetical protein